MKFEHEPAPANPDAPDYKKLQYPILAPGVYGAVLRSYTERKMYNKWESSEQELKGGFDFLITHGANEKELPQFSRAFKMMNFKFTFIPDKGMTSNYFNFLSALLGPDMSKLDFYRKYDDRVLSKIEFNELIGKPLQLLLEPAMKPTKEGVTNMNILQYLPAAKSMREAIGQLMQTAVAEEDDAGKIRYLKSPAAPFTVVGENPSTNGHSTNGYGTGGSDEPAYAKELTDSIPF